jgi:epoxyqueuosine reductase
LLAKSISQQIKESALTMGFNAVRFIPVKPLLDAEAKFLEWRERGYAADMNYLLRENPINARPSELLANARSIIMLTAGYYTPAPPKPGPEWGRVSSYAVGRDYHKVLRSKIKELLNKPELEDIFKHSKFFTDAVPLLEKSFAAEAGLGFQGRNTLLISRATGSYNFILEIITDLEFDYDTEPSDLVSKQACGGCTRCIDICPTGALALSSDLSKQSNGILDSRKCISYLTIENRGEIPDEFKAGIGDWLFGCDLCQDVCPYNAKLRLMNLNDKQTAEFYKQELELAKSRIFPEFHPESGVGHWIHLPSVLALRNEEEFYAKYGGTPLARAKLSGLQRNAKVVLENTGLLVR